MRSANFSVLVSIACLHICPVEANDGSSFPDRLNTFGFNLLQKLETREHRNLLISPASIEIALGMAYAGASGKTAEAMSRALGFDHSSRAAALKELAGLGASLENPGPGVTLKVANAAWIDDSVHLNQRFSADITETFKTKLESIRFNDPGTILRINDWVSSATEGKINRLLQDPPSPPIFLANAVYFHASWKSAFPKQSTKEQPFYPHDGSNLKVKMMRQRSRFRYAKGQEYAVVTLPYVDDGFAMYCFLPDKGVDPLVEELKKSSWSDLSRTLRPTEGSVALPKFKFEYGAALKKGLTELGLGIAFDAHHAEFTRMVDGPPSLYISDVLHKTFLEVDEEGSTAAAVTGIQMKATAIMRPNEEFDLVFDRPFVVAIADEKSGTILFLGIIEEPKG
ncbi:MAG: serpin family protein [Verrucomicrobia bacterium]|nr:serpin family protein [Verrucomicrobiota bacterium]